MLLSRYVSPLACRQWCRSCTFPGSSPCRGRHSGTESISVTSGSESRSGTVRTRKYRHSNGTSMAGGVGGMWGTSLEGQQDHSLRARVGVSGKSFAVGRLPNVIRASLPIAIRIKSRAVNRVLRWCAWWQGRLGDAALGPPIPPRRSTRKGRSYGTIVVDLR